MGVQKAAATGLEGAAPKPGKQWRTARQQNQRRIIKIGVRRDEQSPDEGRAESLPPLAAPAGHTDTNEHQQDQHAAKYFSRYARV